MSRIAWNASGHRYFEAGVDRGVLYIGSTPGVPWSGLISVDQNPSGGETKAYYLDGRKYLHLPGAEEFGATINAYTYPIEFAECDGTARVRPGLFFGEQPRKPFGFSYRTKLGNDVDGLDHAYRIHLVYNALAAPSSRSASTYSDSVDAEQLSWELSTKPVTVSGSKPTAHVVVDTRYTHPLTVQAVENILYGTDVGNARLPTPQELIEIFDVPIVFEVVENVDGTFTVRGPDSNVQDIGSDQILINHPDVAIVDGDSFSITY